MADLNFERKAKVYKIVENALPTVKKMILRDFDRINFKTDEEFNEYLAETSALVDFKEEQRSTHKSNVIDANGPVDLSKVSTGVKSYIDSRKSDYQNPFAGKTGDEYLHTETKSTSAAGSLGGKEI